MMHSLVSYNGGRGGIVGGIVKIGRCFGGCRIGGRSIRVLCRFIRSLFRCVSGGVAGMIRVFVIVGAVGGVHVVVVLAGVGDVVARRTAMAASRVL